jgi:membrane protein implicated in regulation of membrane protease activity
MEQIVWWHWIAFGLLLGILELFVPSFTIIWFGLAAVITGFIMLPWPSMPLWLQLFIWAAASVASTVAWFRYFKPTMVDRTTAGMSKEAVIGETGMIVKPVAGPSEKGVIRFHVPILGAEEWTCISTGALANGDYARVTGIEGHVLLVEKVVNRSTKEM